MAQNHIAMWFHIDHTETLGSGLDWAIENLQESLINMGLGKYVNPDQYTNIKNKVDMKHANDDTMGYLGLKDGKLILILQVYPDDNMIVGYNSGIFKINFTELGSIKPQMTIPIHLSDFGVTINDDLGSYIKSKVTE